MINEFIKAYIYGLIFCMIFYCCLWYFYPINEFPIINNWFNNIANKIYLLSLVTIIFYCRLIQNNKKHETKT